MWPHINNDPTKEGQLAHSWVTMRFLLLEVGFLRENEWALLIIIITEMMSELGTCSQHNGSLGKHETWVLYQ